MVSQKRKYKRGKKTKKKVKIKELVLKKIMSDEKIAKKEGDYFSKKDFPIIKRRL